MNELDELAGLRGDITGRRPEDLVRARETLEAGMRATGRARIWRLRSGVRHPWPGSRPGLRIALTGVVAVAAAAAVTVAVLAGTGTGTSPGRPQPRHGGGTVLTVADVLGQAAAAAARAHQPVPRPNQYIYVSSVDTALSMTGGAVVCSAAAAKKAKAASQHGNPAAYPKGCSAEPMRAWLETDGRQIWLSANGRRTGVLREVLIGQERLPWGVRPPRLTGPRVSWTPLTPPPCHTAPTVGTYTYLTKLPTDPSALRAWLYRHPNGGQRPDAQAWTDIGDLLREMLVPPKLAAALFRVAATIPDATVVPHATDAAGRPGIAVARYDRGFKAGAELIFARHTYQLLGERSVLAQPVKAEGPAGTVIESTAQLRVRVTSQVPHHTSGAQGGVVIGGGC